MSELPAWTILSISSVFQRQTETFSFIEKKSGDKVGQKSDKDKKSDSRTNVGLAIKVGHWKSAKIELNRKSKSRILPGIKYHLVQGSILPRL